MTAILSPPVAEVTEQAELDVLQARYGVGVEAYALAVAQWSFVSCIPSPEEPWPSTPLRDAL